MKSKKKTKKTKSSTKRTKLRKNSKIVKNCNDPTLELAANLRTDMENYFCKIEPIEFENDKKTWIDNFLSIFGISRERNEKRTT